MCATTTAFWSRSPRRVSPGSYGFGLACPHQNSYGMREHGNDWTGNSTYLWAIAGAVYMSLLGPEGFRELGTADRRRARAMPRSCWPRCRASGSSGRTRTFKEFVVNFDDTGKTVAEINDALRARGIFGGKDISGEGLGLGQSALYCVTEVHTAADIRRAGRHAEGGADMTRLPEFHAAKWDEPVVMEMGRPGGRGQLFPAPEAEVTEAVGADLIPAAMARKDRPELPEITEFEAQRHYLHLSQMTLGMMGVSLFGTCTMKYNSKTARIRHAAARAGRGAPLPAPRHAAGRAGDHARLRRHPAVAVGHGPVHLPGRRRGRCGLHHDRRRAGLLGRPRRCWTSGPRW